MKTKNLKLFQSFIFLLCILLPLKNSMGKGVLGFDAFHITKRKNIADAYQRFRKSYEPFTAENSNLKPKEAKLLETLFKLADLAVAEKVSLLEFIGKVDSGEVERKAIYKDYYPDILLELSKIEVSGRIERIRSDLIKGIKHHRDVLMAWLKAARDNKVHTVKSKSGRWIHPGTSAGDKIFSELYHSYIQKIFKDENKENLSALSRHFCVLTF